MLKELNLDFNFDVDVAFSDCEIGDIYDPQEKL